MAWIEGIWDGGDRVPGPEIAVIRLHALAATIDRQGRDVAPEVLADALLFTTAIAASAGLTLFSTRRDEPSLLPLVAEVTSTMAPHVPIRPGLGREAATALRLPVSRLHSGLQSRAAFRGDDIRALIDFRRDVIGQATSLGAPFSPATSPVLARFKAVVADTSCRFASAAKLWAGPPWTARDGLEGNVARNRLPLIRFTDRFRQEGLDGFVIEPRRSPRPRTAEDVGQLLRDVLGGLSAIDPSPRRPMEDVRLTRGWQFSFNDVPMFVMAMSDVYPADHVRHAPSGTFLLLQPSEAFAAHGVGSGHASSHTVKDGVRADFAAAGRPYPAELIDQRLEARLYLLPQNGRPPIDWWRPDSAAGQLPLF